MSEAAKWYVIHTYSGYENKVAQTILKVVRNTRGVTGFVGPGSKPVPLSEKEVAALGVDHGVKAAEADFKIGDRVKITTGPMEGFIGEVKAISSEDNTVDVSVSMFGRETLATLDISQVRVSDEF